MMPPLPPSTLFPYTTLFRSGIERRATPGLQGPKAHLIQLLCDWQHVVETQACGEQGLMSIPQYHIRNPQGLCNLTHGILTFIDHRIIKFAFFAFRKKMSPRTLYSLILIAAMSRNRGGNYPQHALIGCL